VTGDDGSAWYRLAVTGDVRRERSVKPRRAGVTMAIDTGLGLSQCGDLLMMADRWIDHWKLSFGTSALMPANQPSPEQLADQALLDLEWGASWVVVEGRESGTGVGERERAEIAH